MMFNKLPSINTITKRITLCAISFLFGSWFIHSQENIETGEYLARQYQHGSNVLNYRIMFPHNFDANAQYPLVLFLHGGGECGTDNEKQLIHGSKLFRDSLEKYPAVVVFPQCPIEDYWADLTRPDEGGADRIFTFYMDKEPNPSLAAVISLMEEMLDQSFIDKDRFYVSGLSMGGFGTWEMLWRMPEKIAAALPICGGGPPEMAGRMTNVPIWAFHGLKDDVVSYRLTLQMIRAIQRLDGMAKVSFYSDANHNSWDPAFAEPEFLSWMFSKRNSGSTSHIVDSLMSLMTLDEKLGQFNLVTQGGAVTGSVISKGVEDKIRSGQVGAIFGTRGAAKMKKIQEIAVNQSRLGIPLITGMDVIHGHQTILPIPLGLSCSWDPQLIEQGARMAAREATANGLMWNFSPMVDISRDPRWGRIAESAGEDPFLGSKISEAFVRGYQQYDLTDPTTMMACVKHFAAYGAPEGGRDYATVDMSKVKLFNEYLPPYKAAVDAGVGSIMTSFNVIDYVPASGNKELFTDILRDRWNFDGFVVTDYTSILEMIKHGTGNLQEVSAQALKAGIDMDMVTEGMTYTLKKSLEEGAVTMDEINLACRRVLMAKERLGLFEDPYRYFDENREKTEILSPANRAFARKVAGDVQVLLKNEGNVLPIQKDAKIAVIGPLADSRRNMMGTWSVSGNHDLSVTVLEGIQSMVNNPEQILYAKGANISDDPVFAQKVNAFGPEIVIDERSPEEMLKEALTVAADADVILAIVGEAADMSGEASSLSHLTLQPAQQKLLKALKSTGKPVAMVLFTGRPKSLVWEKENMDGILVVWHTGIEAGHAIADVLFGEVNPNAKLTTSFPVNVGQVPVYHSKLNTGRPFESENFDKFKSHYLDIPNEPLFPFGYGLSYTTFEYSQPTLTRTSFKPGEKTTLSVAVTNTGSRKGKEIVQMYIRDLVGTISRPVIELKGFQKIELEPGATKTIYFPIDEELLKFYNYDLEFVAEPGAFDVFVGPNSRDLQKLSFTLEE